MNKSTRKISARELRADLLTGMTDTEIAEKYGISVDRAREFIRRIEQISVAPRPAAPSVRLTESPFPAEDEPAKVWGAENPPANPTQEEKTGPFTETAQDTAKPAPKWAAYRPEPGVERFPTSYTVETGAGTRSAASNDPDVAGAGGLSDFELPGQAYHLDDTGPTTPPAGANVHVLKLYGRIVSDRQKFVNDLGNLLGIPPTEAGQMVDTVPSVIKSGLGRDKAERMKGLLTSIGALCIVEEDMSTENTPPEKQPESTPEFALLMALERTPRREQGLFRMSGSSLALVTSILLLCGIGGYLVLTTGAAREQAFVSGYTVMPRDPVAANVQTVDIRQTVEELRSEIPMLEQEIAMLTHRIEDKKFEFQQARRELHTSQEDLERINRELKELRAELGRKNMELRKARVQFQTFAPPEEPAAQSEPTTPVEKQ